MGEPVFFVIGEGPSYSTSSRRMVNSFDTIWKQLCGHINFVRALDPEERPRPPQLKFVEYRETRFCDPRFSDSTFDAMTKHRHYCEYLTDKLREVVDENLIPRSNDPTVCLRSVLDQMRFVLDDDDLGHRNIVRKVFALLEFNLMTGMIKSFCISNNNLLIPTTDIVPDDELEIFYTILVAVMRCSYAPTYYKNLPPVRIIENPPGTLDIQRCAVCWEDLKCKVLKCKHYVCKVCFMKLEQPHCPLCRAVL